MPHSRAAIMAAWGKYKSVSVFFVVFLIDPALGKQMNRLLGLAASKHDMAQEIDTLPVNAKSVSAMIKDPKRFVENIKKLRKDVLPKFFCGIRTVARIK